VGCDFAKQRIEKQGNKHTTAASLPKDAVTDMERNSGGKGGYERRARNECGCWRAQLGGRKRAVARREIGCGKGGVVSVFGSGMTGWGKEVDSLKEEGTSGKGRRH